MPVEDGRAPWRKLLELTAGRDQKKNAAHRADPNGGKMAQYLKRLACCYKSKLDDFRYWVGANLRFDVGGLLTP